MENTKILFLILCLVMSFSLAACGEKTEDNSEETVQELTTELNQSNTLTLRDSNGNILMTNGIKSAVASKRNDGVGNIDYVVEIQFDDEATKTFAKITEEHMGEDIGIYLNDDMLMSPKVIAVVSNGNCQIDNIDSFDEAKKLAEAIKDCK